jgi:putative ABC transport system substrate-binding protein
MPEGFCLQIHFQIWGWNYLRRCLGGERCLRPLRSRYSSTQPTLPKAPTERGIIQDVARTLGTHFAILNASSPSEIESAFATLVSERAGALVVTGENFFLTQRDLLVELAARHAMPTIYGYSEIVRAGGLISYGARYVDAFRQVAIYTGRILKGEKAGDLPVYQVTRIELAINLKTAKALGLAIPLPLLGRADVVIE